MKMPHWPIPIGYKTVDLGLKRVKESLERLGNPELKLPPVVHFAGTNGKGSTIAFIRAILEAAGYLVHTYTSPHLVDFNERIVLAGKEIGDDFLYEILEECRLASEGISITFFEGTTIAAFLAFSRVSADIVLLETGLGGRLDATNILEKPALTVITPISRDHTEFLGNTLESIAFEKASIMKEGIPCIISLQEDEALREIEKMAENKNSKLFRHGSEWNIEKNGNEESVSYKSSHREIEIPHLGLIGEHQAINFGTAVACIDKLESFTISDEACILGGKNATWAGRLQKIASGNFTKLLPSGCELWIDGGHNEAAGKILGKQVSKWRNNDRELPLYIIVGMMKGKDCKEFLKPLTGYVKCCYCIEIPNEDDSYNGAKIKRIAEGLGMMAITADSGEEAIRHIITNTDKVSRILVCGSLYLVGSFLEQNGK